MSGAKQVDDTARQLARVPFQFDDERDVGVTAQHVGQRRHVERLELCGGAVGHAAAAGRRAIQRLVMVDDDDAVSGKVNVELETVGAAREAVVESCDGVFRTKRRATPMRVHQRRAPFAPLRSRGSLSCARSHRRPS